MTETVVEKLIVNCAHCRKELGFVTNEGWTWKGAPCRLVNRRRFVTSAAVGEGPSLAPCEEAPSAPWDDFRMRSVERNRFEDPEYAVWEYPYTCDSDECTNGLGADWEPRKGPAFQVMPPGRTLS